MSGDIVRAWDALARRFCDETGGPIEAARDRVILLWLQRGDTRPFYDWVLSGHNPARDVVVT
jgi:hypothetical protein